MEAGDELRNARDALISAQEVLRECMDDGIAKKFINERLNTALRAIQQEILRGIKK